MKSRILLKLLLVFILVIAAVTLTLDIAIRNAWQSSLQEQIALYDAINRGDAPSPPEGGAPK